MTAVDIVASKVNIGIGKLGSLQKGPDGKIYQAKPGANSIDVINNPEISGSGCGFVDGGQSLGTGVSKLGLPNSPVASIFNTVFSDYIVGDTSISPGSSVSVGGPAKPNHTYAWSPSTGLDDSTLANPIATPAVTTTYYLLAQYNCNSIVDSITVYVSSSGSGDSCLFITEISMRPCCSSPGQQTREFVEFFNSSYTDTVDVNGWFIQTDVNNDMLAVTVSEDKLISWETRYPSTTPIDSIPGFIVTNSTKIPPRRMAVIFAPRWNTISNLLYDIGDSVIALTLENYLYWGADQTGNTPPNGLLYNEGDFITVFNGDPSLPSTDQIDSLGWYGVTAQDEGLSLQRDDDCVFRFYRSGSTNPAVGYDVDSDSTILLPNSIGWQNVLGSNYPTISIIASDTNVSCLGDYVSFVPLDPISCTPYNYSWDFGDPSSGASNSSSSSSPSHAFNDTGTYTVTVMAESGCVTITGSISIVVSGTATTPSAGMSDTLAVCFSSPPLDLTSLMTGSPDTNGTWTPLFTSGTNTFDVTVDGYGIFRYIVGGIGTCDPDTAFITIIGCCPTVVTEAITDVSCLGLCDGKIILNIDSGIAPYTVEWFDSSGTSLGVMTGVTASDSITGLCANNYSVSVTDSSGSPAGGTGIFWTEGFNNGCVSLCLASAYTGGNGSWTQTNLSGNDPFANEWYVSDAESGGAVNTCVFPGSGDPTLHVGIVPGSPSAGGSCPSGDCGATYDSLPTTITNKRIESPTIDCSLQESIIMNFSFIGYGDPGNDSITVVYSDNNGATWNPIPGGSGISSKCCCLITPSLGVCSNLSDPQPCSDLWAGRGNWAGSSLALPASCNNSALVKVGFVWVNNGDNIGSDPSFAVNDIELVGTVSAIDPCIIVKTFVVNGSSPANAGTDGAHAFCSSDSPADLLNDLSGSPDTIGSWSPALNSGSGLFDPSLDAIGTVQYIVPANGGCLGDTSEVLVTIEQRPIAGNDVTLNICSTGSAFNLIDSVTGSPELSGIWIPALASGTDAYDPSLDLAGTYQYVVAGTAPCSNDTAVITVIDSLGSGCIIEIIPEEYVVYM
ncbi:MAG TPA: PKD domain-containing protein, partial [Flavobacteriales bacterium]|nr:PKD domain-containing protein [Flavobacteriales bacterium]